MKNRSFVTNFVEPIFTKSLSALYLFLVLVQSMVCSGRSQTYFYITNFDKSNNLQNSLQASFPSGLYIATNGLETPFDIVTNASGNNFAEVQLNRPLIVTNINLPNVSKVYTIMNAYAPPAGTLATVTFVGSSGAAQTFPLVGNSDIRDFYDGSWDNFINGTNAQPIYSIGNVVGGASTGNSATGLHGTYRLDEQRFILTALPNQNLQTMVFSNITSSSTPFVAGITAELERPAIAVAPAVAGQLVLSWPGSTLAYRLQQNSTLSGGNWITSPNTVSILNNSNVVNVSTSSTNLFYRLIYP